MGRKMKIRTCGIYDIVNNANGKHYVGQSVHIERRLRHHRRLLNNGIHVNTHLQNAWNLYGEQSFEFKIAEVCQSDLLCEREQHWMDELKTLTDGYNIWHATESTNGYKHEPETLALLRLISEPRYKSVIQFDLSGKVLNVFNSMKDAEDKSGVTHISDCCTGKCVSAGGFLWAFEKKFIEDGVSMKDRIKTRKPRVERPVVKMTFDFSKVAEFGNMSEAARDANTSHCAIRQVCLGNTFCVDNHRWMFKEDFEDALRLTAYQKKVKGKGRFRNINEQKEQVQSSVE